MDAGVAQTKAALRKEMLRLRRALPPQTRLQASLACARLALELIPSYQNRLVALYGSMPDELDTAPLAQGLLAQGAHLTYPKVISPRELAFYPATPEQLVISEKNIPEPFTNAPFTPINMIDIFFVPGLAFDKQGGRLGFGGGFYDRTLAHTRPTALRIGYAFACQLLEQLPTQEHDQRVQAVITEEGIWRAAEGPFTYKA